MFITPRSSRAVPSSLVPRQIHSPTPPLQNGETEELGPEVRNALEELRSVLPDLAPAAEGSRRMGRLVTSVILIEAGKLSLQVMCIQCMERTLAHRFAKPSLPLI